MEPVKILKNSLQLSYLVGLIKYLLLPLRPEREMWVGRSGPLPGYYAVTTAILKEKLLLSLMQLLEKFRI